MQCGSKIVVCSCCSIVHWNVCLLFAPVCASACAILGVLVLFVCLLVIWESSRDQYWEWLLLPFTPLHLLHFKLFFMILLLTLYSLPFALYNIFFIFFISQHLPCIFLFLKTQLQIFLLLILLSSRKKCKAHFRYLADYT